MKIELIQDDQGRWVGIDFDAKVLTVVTDTYEKREDLEKAINGGFVNETPAEYETRTGRGWPLK